ncbi:TolC family outer membrane protein [Aureimonas fodinaquatilis]|uniref:TolC family outer membrane protein n=1 Tax=Aureimonas fodinaquatilis TaxID=2565783 RepID=A0A5B0DXX7_9HYPH|nr:TolC family outer membrane protein [Aureimonas fodinaquatilis]KAA0970601.1 TolC family outer membrane protein [Aureimonas fodinaquatilis]
MELFIASHFEEPDQSRQKHIPLRLENLIKIKGYELLRQSAGNMSSWRGRKIFPAIAAALSLTATGCTTANLDAAMPATASTVSAKTISEPRAAAEQRSTRPGASGEGLTLEKAVVRAVDWHPTISEAASRTNQAGDEIDVARAGYFPQVRGGVSSVHDDASRRGNWNPQLSVTGSQMLYDFGKVSSSVAAARAAHDASRSSLLITVDDVILETAAAMVEVYRNRELAAVAQDQVRGIADITDLVHQRTDRGASTRSDAVQANARLQAAQSTELQIRADQERWESELVSLIGADSLPGLAPRLPASLATACEKASLSIDTVPAAQRALAEQREAQAQLRSNRARALPTLAVEVGAGYDILDNGSDELLLGEDDSRTEIRGGLSLSSSIFEGGASAARNRAAANALQAANAGLDNARFEATRKLREARQQTLSLSRLLASLRTREPTMRETRDMYRKQYLELGTRSLLDLLNAEQELHAARFDVARTTGDIQRLGLDCQYSAGQLRTAFGLQGASLRGVTFQP